MRDDWGKPDQAADDDGSLAEMIREEWDDMYPDVIKDLCLGATRIPDDKLTLQLFGRLVRREILVREQMISTLEEFADFNRVWVAMLDVIKHDLEAHLPRLLAELPAVRAAIVKQGGRAYAEGQDALSRRETELLQRELDVDRNWVPN